MVVATYAFDFKVSKIKWFIFLRMKTVFTLKFQIKRTFYRYFIYSVFVFVTHILV